MSAPLSSTDGALDRLIVKTALAKWERLILDGTTITERDHARRECSLWRQTLVDIEAGR